MADKVNEQLNKALANYSIYYQKLRNYHWNVSGKMFFALHAKFEELYDEAAEHIDQIAEQILIRGGKPLSCLQDYLKVSELQEDHETPKAAEMVTRLVSDIKVLVQSLKSAADLADDAEDSSTEDLLGLMIAGHEKSLWMLRAFLAE